MKLLILRSVINTTSNDPFSTRIDTHYADRVIANLTDKGGFCRACADTCVSCRSFYTTDFSKNIAGIISFPSLLPAIVEEPAQFLPDRVPDHDIMLAIAVNEEILIAFIERFSASKGIIIPIERSNWISPHAIHTITGICRDKDIEVSFPKPFCSFSPKSGILKEFRNYFRIGKPDIRYTIDNGCINDTKVLVSAPCGATYFTAQGLQNRNSNDTLELILDNRLSSYPCTADTSVDREFRDSITHQAVKIQRDLLNNGTKRIVV